MLDFVNRKSLSGKHQKHFPEICLTTESMKIVIETGTPRNEQAGDWYEDEDTGDIHITTTDMPRASVIAIAVHELVEWLLCEDAGITDQQVTIFDAQFESERVAGLHKEKDEAGDDTRSPYRDQHEAATFAERAVCAALNLWWEKHEKDVLRSLE